MGYGGALIWTAVARNAVEHSPGKKVVFIYRNRWRDFLLGRPLPQAEIYRGNPDIAHTVDKRIWPFFRLFFSADKFVFVDMTDPAGHYWEKDSAQKVFYKKGRHAIEFACEPLGILHPRLAPRIVFSRVEEEHVRLLLEANGLTGRRYICLEPQARFSFSMNKEWFWERWQELVSRLNAHFAEHKMDVTLVQIGMRGRSLNGVVDLTGKTTFCEAGIVLRGAQAYVGYVGGLVHLNKAVGKKSVVLISGWEPRELAAYPDDINFYVPLACSGCGLKTPCPHGRACMDRIGVDDVFKAVLEGFL